MYIAAFNHLTPFPGTPLYQRLAAEAGCSTRRGGSTTYRYNMIPFRPAWMTRTRSAPLPGGAANVLLLAEHCEARIGKGGQSIRFFHVQEFLFESTECCATNHGMGRLVMKHGAGSCCACTEPTKQPLRTPFNVRVAGVRRQRTGAPAFARTLFAGRSRPDPEKDKRTARSRQKSKVTCIRR